MTSTKIPEWVYSCLDQYANCACGRNLVTKLGKDKLLSILEDDGYPCELEILSDVKDQGEFPKDGTYILTLKNRKELDLDELELEGDE